MYDIFTYCFHFDYIQVGTNVLISSQQYQGYNFKIRQWCELSDGGGDVYCLYIQAVMN
jgi:hypothetical protein